MTLKEAFKILGASKKDSEREIKSKYKKLLFLYHPDSDPGKERNLEDDEKIRQIIEAYKKIRASEGQPYYEDEHTYTVYAKGVSTTCGTTEEKTIEITVNNDPDTCNP